MRTYELVAMSIAAGAVFVPLITWAVLWLFRRDRIFTALPAGEVPAEVDGAPSTRVGPGTEYSGEVPLRTSPPAGVSPGLAGVVLDGYADGRDIAAMVLDLARRGWFQLGAASAGAHARDWRITRVDKPLDATLDLNEVYLITNIAAPGGTTSMSELRAKGDNRLGLVQLDLAREVVARGWYPAPPDQPSDVPMAVLGLGGLLGIVVALVDVTSVSVCAGAVVVACTYLTSLIVRGTTPRTALGTAVRVQVLGFRRYLLDAHSHQFSYLEAAGTFREYLPWAVVFGLEQQWATTFAELDVVAEAAELHLAQDLRWFAGIRGPADALTPTSGPALGESTPRRLAIATILEAARSSILEHPTPRTQVPALIQSAPVTTGAAEDEQRVERFAPPPERRSLLARTSEFVSRVAHTVRPAAPVVPSPVPPMPDLPALAEPVGPASPATPVRVGAVPPSEPVAGAEPVAAPAPELVAVAPAPVVVAPSPVAVALTPEPVAAVAPPEPVVEALPAVRQWVPRPSERPAPLAARPRAAMPASALQVAPAAPVTPRRPPRVDAAPPEQPAVRPPDPTPGDDQNPWTGWLHELDLAMSGDFDAEGPDATEGGTVISGPQRFDVLLAMPLWPDVPRGEERPDLRAG